MRTGHFIALPGSFSRYGCSIRSKAVVRLLKHALVLLTDNTQTLLRNRPHSK
jgi:hypothetical protein